MMGIKTGAGVSDSRRENGCRRNKARKHKERQGDGKQSPTQKFDGKTLEMAGHVFQTQKEESPTPRQFKTTMEQLEHWVGLKTKFPEDLMPTFGDKIVCPNINVPDDLSEEEKKSAARVRLWEKRIDMTAKREMALETSLKQLYMVVWGQCSEGMKAQIRANQS